jgi:Protein of unknown function (DUF3226)
MTFPLDWSPSSKNQVIGESYSDGGFIKAVANAYNVPAFDFTAPLDKDKKRALGKSGFKTHLVGMRAFIDRQRVSRVVIVGDNDADHADALTDVRRASRDAGGYPTAPVNACETGKSGSGDLWVGIAMLPGIKENGCLETLLLKAKRETGPTQECLDSWQACSAFPVAHKNNLHKFILRSVLSASVHGEPNVSVERMWDKPDNPIKASDPAFKWLADFLKEMFS